MRKRITGLMLALLLVAAAPVFATAADDGGLSADLIARIRDGFTMDSHTRAMMNAVTNTDIKNIAVNRSLVAGQEDNFNHKIKTKGITDQKSSGRCWLFAGLNVLRPKVISEFGLDGFEFSQSYEAFWDKMEKANMFYEEVIRLRDRDYLDREMEMLLSDPIGDGGWWNYTVALVEKYGVVPKSIMPESNSSSKTGMLNNRLAAKMRADACRLRKMYADGATVEQLRQTKETMLGDIYKILVINYGVPPTKFDYRYKGADSTLSPLKNYTPQSFYHDFVDENLGDYVALFNDPAHPTGKHYIADGARDIFDRKNLDFINVDMSVLKDVALKSVLDDEPVWFACDVGADQDRKLGIMAVGIYDYDDVYGIDSKMSKADRILYRQTTANHAMVITGVDTEDDKPVKWLVENSWGTDDGDKGMWTMYNTWFDEHVFNVVVKRKYVPEKVLKLFDEKPETLPPWDPLATMSPR